MAHYSSYPHSSNYSNMPPPPPPPPLPTIPSSSNSSYHHSSSSSHHNSYNNNNNNNNSNHLIPPSHSNQEYKPNKNSSYGPVRGSQGYYNPSSGSSNTNNNNNSNGYRSSRNSNSHSRKNYNTRSYSRSRSRSHSRSRSYSPPSNYNRNNNNNNNNNSNYRNGPPPPPPPPAHSHRDHSSSSFSSSNFYRGNNNNNNNGNYGNYNNNKNNKNEFGIISGQPGSTLSRIDWSKIQLQPFQKNFYREASTLNDLSEQEIEIWRKDNDIYVSGRNIPKPIRTFEEAGFPDYILTEIRRAQFNKPTAIQSQGWPMAMSGRDVIGIAETGSGKTLAFLLPCIVHINAQPLLRNGDGPITLIIAPTRELAYQIDNEAKKFATSSKIKHTCVYGGITRRPQMEKLRNGVEIIICTPGRLLDFLESKVTNLKRVTYLVIDEADRLLDMGFEPQLKAILSQVRPDRQILMWSATWPVEVRSLASEFMNKDTIQVSIGSLEITANHSVTQIIEVVQNYEKMNKLIYFIKQHRYNMINNINYDSNNNNANSNSNSINYNQPLKPTINSNMWKILVFTSTKRMCDDVTKLLKQDGWPVTSIHGDKEQYERDSALESFKSGKTQIMLATDVASRGIHVDNITLVINYDFPANIEDYVHRIGRTARCGKTGIAISFITKDDVKRIPKLIAVLNEANQTVPPNLIALANQPISSSASSNYSRYNNNNNNQNHNHSHHMQSYRPPNSNISSSSASSSLHSNAHVSHSHHYNGSSSSQQVSSSTPLPSQSQQGPVLNYGLDHYHVSNNHYMMNNVHLNNHVHATSTTSISNPVQV